jgi:glycerophosphoryl diester phosphodiesterase
VACYADAVGISKDAVIPRDAQGRLGAATTLVAQAHAAGLAVHAWTFRAENSFLPADCRAAGDDRALGDLGRELRAFLEADIDGFFTDQPDLGRTATHIAVPDKY